MLPGVLLSPNRRWYGISNPSTRCPTQLMNRIDELIIQSLKGQNTTSAEADLRQWRERSTEIERRYRMIAELWSVTRAAAPVREGLMPPAADVLIALAEAEESVQSLSPVAAVGPRRGWWASPKVAALAAGLVGLGLGLGEILRPEAAPYLPLAEGQITTGDGERTTFVLGNGTSIRLGANSRLRVRREGLATVAELDGRAFFGVKSDSLRPFIVRTKYGEAVVHGTRFEVRSEEEEFRVLVVDGKVRISTAGVVTDLSAGDVGLSMDGAPATTFRVNDVKRQLDWMGETLIFQGTPLWRAIEEIESRYDVDIVLETPSLGDLTVTATFTDQEWDRVVLVLCEVVRAKCSIEGDEVRIR